jgi:hypothetical protein
MIFLLLKRKSQLVKYTAESAESQTYDASSDTSGAYTADSNVLNEMQQSNIQAPYTTASLDVSTMLTSTPSCVYSTLTMSDAVMTQANITASFA